MKYLVQFPTVGLSIFPIPVKLLYSSATGLQIQMLWGLFLILHSQAGEPDMGLRAPTPVGEPLRYQHFPAYGSLQPLPQVWNLIMSWKLSIYYHTVVSSLSLDIEYIFVVAAVVLQSTSCIWVFVTLWATEGQNPLSVFFIVQLSQPYMTTGKTIALTIWAFVSKVMPLLFNMLSRLDIVFLPRSNHLLI